MAAKKKKAPGEEEEAEMQEAEAQEAEAEMQEAEAQEAEAPAPEPKPLVSLARATDARGRKIRKGNRER